MDGVAGEKDLRACVGETGGGALATLWHAVGTPGRLIVKADAGRVRAVDAFGKPVDLPAAGEETVALPFGHRRTTVLFDGLSAAAVRKLLMAGRVRKP
jgi:hypothetical protein